MYILYAIGYDDKIVSKVYTNLTEAKQAYDDNFFKAKSLELRCYQKRNKKVREHPGPIIFRK